MVRTKEGCLGKLKEWKSNWEEVKKLEKLEIGEKEGCVMGMSGENP